MRTSAPRPSKPWPAVLWMLAACADAPPAQSPVWHAENLKPDRPAGIADCNTEVSDNLQVTRDFWRAFLSSDYTARARLDQPLQVAIADHPDEAQLVFLQAHLNLWRISERISLNDQLSALSSAAIADEAFTRAYALCPTDHRIPAWLGPLKIMMGELFADPARVQDGQRLLALGVQHYPAFATFSNVILYGDAPRNSPELDKALDAARATLALPSGFCRSMPDDPSCGNSGHVPHNIEGTAVYLGDVFARAQDRELALSAYTLAKASPDWPSWPFQGLLEERIETLDHRMAAAANAIDLDDPEFAGRSTIQCALCHRQ